MVYLRGFARPTTSWSLALVMALGLLLIPAAPTWAGPVNWQEIPATAEGRQWWDLGSLHRTKGGYLSVLSRFQAPSTEGERPPLGDLYVMEIDCDQQLYRDTSVNGLPKFGATWLPASADSLVTEVIQASCAAFTP